MKSQTEEREEGLFLSETHTQHVRFDSAFHSMTSLIIPNKAHVSCIRVTHRIANVIRFNIFYHSGHISQRNMYNNCFNRTNNEINGYTRGMDVMTGTQLKDVINVNTCGLLYMIQEKKKNTECFFESNNFLHGDTSLSYGSYTGTQRMLQI